MCTSRELTLSGQKITKDTSNQFAQTRQYITRAFKAYDESLN